MPALTKVALATALTLSLAGGVTALAQSTDATQGHTTYVTLILSADDPAGQEQVLEGTVPCEAPLHTRIARSYLGRPDCKHDGYAYAFPQGEMSPWEGDVQWVNDSRYVNEEGRVWHVTEIVYRTLDQAPEGGAELVHAMAAELKPVDRSDDAGASYALPVRGELLETDASRLTVSVGPAPTPTAAGATPGEPL